MRCEHDGMMRRCEPIFATGSTAAADGRAHDDPRPDAGDRRHPHDGAAYGLTPVVCLAAAFERAIRAQPRGCPAGLYFDRLRDAIGCERLDDAASESLLASVSIRFEV